MEFYRSSDLAYTPEQAAWGAPTSTLNFCEQDYEFTRYIAELFNTLTNLTYIILGLHGLINSRALFPASTGARLPYIALINLGIASSLFHSTLKYPGQLCDEFSMLLATFIVFYRLMCFSQSRFSPAQLMGMSIGVVGICAVGQWWLEESTVQQIVFTGMVYWLWYTCFKLIAKVTRDDLRRSMRWMAISGIALFVGGHACWATDFYACDSLRETRAMIGMPWAAALELHGLWHILTGVGVYIFIVLVECLRFAQPDVKGDDSPQLAADGIWPFMVYLVKETGRGAEKKDA